MSETPHVTPLDTASGEGPAQAEASPAVALSTATRKDLQLARRLFHMANGVAIATAYGLLFTHPRVVHLFGTIACLVYVAEQIRIHYPEVLSRAPWVSRLFYRAEEQFKESAMVPYAIAILLTLLTFPQAIAMIAIYTLAIADPLSALVGIRWGRRRIVPDKTLEGSAAFVIAAFAVSAGVLYTLTATTPGRLIGASAVIAFLGAVFEMLPLRIDDNLTIPLFVGFSGWGVCSVFAIPLA